MAFRSVFRRAGKTVPPWLGGGMLLVGLLALLTWNVLRRAPETPPPLIVYCAAGLKTPVEAIAREYEEKYGVPIQLQYGGSQTLLANLEISRQGDLYLPADDNYLELARSKGLLDETLPLAEMAPVLAVAKGNPRNLRVLADLIQGNAVIAQANPDAAAVGQLTRAVLRKSGHWDALEKRTAVFKPTVNDVANDIALGSADAGFVWDAIVGQYPALEAVSLPELSGASAHMSIAVLHGTEQPTAALRFARYLTAWDRGCRQFERNGFRPVQGDFWSENPEIRLLAGAMLRPAIEQTITAFEEREGVRVLRVYNGCGILVGQMRAGERPDAYFACDRSFLDQVNDLFLDAVDISTNQLAILVPQGNPHAIRNLKDLGKPGLKVGIGHEKQCAMGVLTQRTFRQGSARAEAMKNVVVQSPTGDLLVNQLLTGSLDAAVAYVSNAKSAGDKLEAIAIDLPCAQAIQPVAIGKDSVHKYLTRRLLEAIRSRQSRERFEASGFHWQAGSKKP